VTSAGVADRPQLSPQVAQALKDSSRRIVITGSSGWLGMATLELLHEALGSAVTDRVRCYGSAEKALALRAGLKIEQRPLRELRQLEREPTFLMHLAFLTKDRAESMDEAAYRQANRALSGIVLDALDHIGVDGLFIASSGAARSAEDDAAAPAMRLYGSLKKEDENSFSQWAELQRKTAVIARIFNLSGPYINKHTAYALAAFINNALASEPIVVRAPMPVVRSYVAIRELMSLVLAVLLDDPKEAVRFDTAGAALDLKDVAQIVSAAVRDVPVERAALQSDRADIYVGEAEPYRSLLDRYGIEAVNIDQQVRETADYLRAV
jgi:UDP-glucuronate decarboxylase